MWIQVILPFAMPGDSERGDGESLFQRVYRRGVLRSVGAGAALSVGGYGLASQEGDGDDETPTPSPTPTEDGAESAEVDRRCDPCIDTLTGYAVLSPDEQLPGDLQSDHQVDMRIADVDVLFQDEEEPGEMPTGTPGEGTPTATPTGNTTGNATGNETATPQGTPTATPTETPENGAQPAGFPDFFFDPVGLLVRPGDVVEFRSLPPEISSPGTVTHTITAFHPRTGLPQRVPGEVPGFSSGPVYVEESWLYRFDAQGVYDVLCLPHFGLGMVMRLVVLEEGSDTVPEAPPEPQAGEQGLPGAVAQVFAAPELAPQNIVDQEAVAWTDLTIEATGPPIGGPGGGPEGGGGGGDQGQDGAGGNETSDGASEGGSEGGA